MKQATDLDKICKKMMLRILPLVVLMFMLSFLDRSNLSFVKTHIEIDAGIGAAAYALGASIFFIGYWAFEVPSNLILHKVGARIWLGRIMFSWGLVTMSMCFIQGEKSFYILRFLLGLTEAGFSPGIILYLSYFFPSTHRSKAYGLYQAGVPLAIILGGPLSGLILDYMPPLFNFSNWQWMFIIEGGVTALVGIYVFFGLVSKPEDATWLDKQEKAILKEALKADQAGVIEISLLKTFSNALVWKFVFIYFCIQLSVNGVLFYLPTRIAEFMGTGVGFVVGLLNAIPWVCVLLLMPLLTARADKGRSWRVHAIVLLSCAALGMSSSTLAPELISFLILTSLAVVGFIVIQPIFWNLPTQALKGSSAAAGIALIGSFGNLGGFVAPNLRYYAETLTGYPHAGLIALSLVAICGVFMLVNLKNQSVKECNGSRNKK